MERSEPRSTDAGSAPDECKSLEARLERGEIVYFPVCPFELPKNSDLELLLEQRVAGSATRHIQFDPLSAQIQNSACTDRATLHRLAGILAIQAQRATVWLAGSLTRYAGAWQIGSSTLRPEEEATRRLRFSLREDLLHVDSFPAGASRGRRLLRLFVNLNPTEPRVWATSDALPRLLERFGDAVGVPSAEHTSWTWQVRQGVLGLLDSRQRGRSAFDDYVLRLQNHLRANDLFQEKGPKRFWHFAPGSAWLVMTDGVSHAVLRGRHALEMSLYIDPATLACPDQAPARLIEGYRKQTGNRRAA